MTHDTKVANLAVKPVPAPPTDFDGPRDPPALWDLAKTAPYFWDGDVPTRPAAVLRPVMGHGKLFQTGDCANTTSADCDAEAGRRVAALVAYIETLQPPATSFDEGTLSPAALRGEKLFRGKGGCIECHGGPHLPDNLIHNTGVPQVTFTSPYGTGTRKSNDLGAPPPPPDPACAGPNPAAGPAVRGPPPRRRRRRPAPRHERVHQHTSAPRPRRDGAVHAQRRVQDAHRRRPVLQPAVDPGPAEHDGQRGRRPGGLPPVALAEVSPRG